MEPTLTRNFDGYICNFRGVYSYLSNFYEAPFYISCPTNGLEGPWKTVEHFFQAAKTADVEGAREIMDSPDAQSAKRMGHCVELIPGWEEVKYELMYRGVYNKFKQNPHLAVKLLSTGAHILVEGNTWYDATWGVPTNAGVMGANLLGEVLMAVREQLIRGYLLEAISYRKDHQYGPSGHVLAVSQTQANAHPTLNKCAHLARIDLNDPEAVDAFMIEVMHMDGGAGLLMFDPETEDFYYYDTDDADFI